MSLVHYNEISQQFYSCVGGYVRVWDKLGELTRETVHEDVVKVSSFNEEIITINNRGQVFSQEGCKIGIDNVVKRIDEVTLTYEGILNLSYVTQLRGVKNFTKVKDNYLVHFNSGRVVLFDPYLIAIQTYPGMYFNEVDLHDGDIYERGVSHTCYHNGYFGYGFGYVEKDAQGGKFLFGSPVLDLAYNGVKLLATDGNKLAWV